MTLASELGGEHRSDRSPHLLITNLCGHAPRLDGDGDDNSPRRDRICPYPVRQPDQCCDSRRHYTADRNRVGTAHIDPSGYSWLRLGGGRLYGLGHNRESTPDCNSGSGCANPAQMPGWGVRYRPEPLRP